MNAHWLAISAAIPDTNSSRSEAKEKAKHYKFVCQHTMSLHPMVIDYESLEARISSWTCERIDSSTKEIQQLEL